VTDNPYARPSVVPSGGDTGGDPVAGPASRHTSPVVAEPLEPVDAGPGALVLRGVSVAYGPLVALHEVDLLAEPGTLLALAGPSGAGKSTLLWAAAGAVAPSAGEVTAAGSAVTDRRSGVRSRIALIPQGNGLAGVLTAYENVAFPLLALGVPAAQIQERVRARLADVGLEESADHLVEELSGGQQQRVAIARGLAAEAAVLLADEPTSELDHANRGRVLDLLRLQARRGAVVVMATHDPEAAAVADREVRLDEGRLTVVR
jgi:putative ABC transport system ATP-binding protein